MLCRTPHHSVTHLYLSHCGLSDRDGSLILNALVDAAASSSGDWNSSGCGSSTSTSSGCSAYRSSSDRGRRGVRGWVLLDLAYNALEGGAALCSGALVTAEADTAAAAATAASSSRTGGPVPFCLGSSCGPSGVDGMQCHVAGLSKSASYKRLVLDGNPLGASGVRILMRAIAAQPAVAMGAAGSLFLESQAAASTSGTARAMSAAASGQCDVGEGTAAAFFLPAQPGRGVDGGESGRYSQGLQVSIAKVSLLGKEKGFRASLRAAEAAQAFTTQVGLPQMGHLLSCMFD
jgi:hypothetical protein